MVVVFPISITSVKFSNFEPLANPVGERIQEGLLSRSDSGHGSLVPSFCKEYVKNTKGQVLAIHCARGDTSIAEWLKGTPRFDALIEKAKSGIKKAKKNYDIDKIYFVWLQGESDALKFTGTQAYLDMLKVFKNDLKEQLSIDKFAIIKQGYFCVVAPWMKEPKQQKKKSDKEIMRAFDIAPKIDNDFVLLTSICKRLSMNKKYINPNAVGHYSNLGMKVIGTKAGRKLAKLRIKN